MNLLEWLKPEQVEVDIVRVEETEESMMRNTPFPRLAVEKTGRGRRKLRSHESQSDSNG